MIRVVVNPWVPPGKAYLIAPEVILAPEGLSLEALLDLAIEDLRRGSRFVELLYRQPAPGA